jgi:hypothetical protein
VLALPPAAVGDADLGLFDGDRVMRVTTEAQTVMHEGGGFRWLQQRLAHIAILLLFGFPSKRLQ